MFPTYGSYIENTKKDKQIFLYMFMTILRK